MYKELLNTFESFYCSPQLETEANNKLESFNFYTEFNNNIREGRTCSFEFQIDKIDNIYICIIYKLLKEGFYARFWTAGTSQSELLDTFDVFTTELFYFLTRYDEKISVDFSLFPFSYMKPEVDLI